jgi:hypothetical protein
MGTLPNFSKSDKIYKNEILIERLNLMREIYSNILLIVGWLLLVFSIYLFLWTFIEVNAFYIGICVLVVGLLSLFISKKIDTNAGNFLSLYDR